MKLVASGAASRTFQPSAPPPARLEIHSAGLFAVGNPSLSPLDPLSYSGLRHA